MNQALEIIDLESNTFLTHPSMVLSYVQFPFPSRIRRAKVKNYLGKRFYSKPTFLSCGASLSEEPYVYPLKIVQDEENNIYEEQVIVLRKKIVKGTPKLLEYADFPCAKTEPTIEIFENNQIHSAILTGHLKHSQTSPDLIRYASIPNIHWNPIVLDIEVNETQLLIGFFFPSIGKVIQLLVLNFI